MSNQDSASDNTFDRLLLKAAESKDFQEVQNLIIHGVPIDVQDR